MILKFKVSGFCSINEEQELNFAALPNQRIKGTRYEYNYTNDKWRASKSTIIFGNNSTGKTNLILALHACLSLIEEDVALNKVKSFCLFQETPVMSFELTVSRGLDVFCYAIEFNKDQILRERLFCNGNSIYEFEDNKLHIGVNIANQEQIEKIYSVKSTSILLRKIRDFIPNYVDDLYYATTRIVVLTPDPFNQDGKYFKLTVSDSAVEFLMDKKALALELFRNVDKSITDFTFKKIENIEGASHEFVFYRKDRQGKSVSFDHQTESQGIKRMIVVIGWLVQVMREECTLVVDELDAPISSKSLLSLFVDFVQQPENERGQLIVSSHNLELFSIDYFSPAQIYVANKNKNLSTVVNSLAEYDIRSNQKRLALRFLQGAFEL